MIRTCMIVCFVVFSSTILATTPLSNKQIAKALATLRADVEARKSMATNPLHLYNLEAFQSRSYLYYYRALGYMHMAKTSKNPLPLVNKALEDAQRATSSLHFDDLRLEQLRLQLLKDKINFLREKKNYAAVISTIEQLPQKINAEAQYVLWYAEALFKTGKLDDFKRLARRYALHFADEKLVQSHIVVAPNWAGVLKALSAEKKGALKKPISTPNEDAPVIMDKSSIVANPREAINFLKHGAFFTQSNKIFSLSSEIYFSFIKKNFLNSPESNFVATFESSMSDFAPQFLDGLITSFWSKTDLESAEKLSLSFLNKYPWHANYPKVLYNLGRIQEDGQHYQKAAETFKQFIKTTDDPTYIELAHFRLAWMTRLSGKLDQAHSHFASYLKKYPEGRYASTSEYAHIKFLEKTHGKEAAIGLAKAYVTTYPFSLYAFLLMDEFGLPQSLVRDVFSSEAGLLAIQHEINSFSADIKTLSLLKVYDELLAFGLKDDAITVLKGLPYDKANDLLALFLAVEFQKLDDVSGELKNIIHVATRETPLRKHISLTSLFPHAQHDKIRETLSTQNAMLSPWLVLSLIRQESVFDPKARSSARAMGLMQLTEGAARQAAKELQIKEFSLFNEEDNIKLGVHMFNGLLQKYEYRIDYALAAYNAGETPTRLWIKLRGHLAPIDFIESIPYPETRTYIKSILRNLAMYRMIYGTKDSPLVSFRENVHSIDAPISENKVFDEMSVSRPSSFK